jgi:hypothetical protein
VWKNRFRNWDGISICLISVDGTDCPIEELYPFDKGIFSEKLNGPGYKYEVGVCIRTADIVWVNGPFKAGRADKTIFQEDGLRDALCDDECVEADAGYQGDDKLKNPNISQSKTEVAAYETTISSRLFKNPTSCQARRILPVRIRSIRWMHTSCDHYLNLCS